MNSWDFGNQVGKKQPITGVFILNLQQSKLDLIDMDNDTGFKLEPER